MAEITPFTIGSAATCTDGASAGEVSSRTQWVGSASVPGSIGYVDIGMLLAVMDVSAGIIELRVRPGLVRFMFGIENLSTTPQPGTVIFPAHKFGQSGIEIKRKDKPSCYFWTGHRSDVLASAAAAGFAVSPEEKAMSYRTASRRVADA